MTVCDLGIYRTHGNFCGMKFSVLYTKAGFSRIYFHDHIRTSVFRGSVLVKVLVIFFALDTCHKNSNCCKPQNFHGFYSHGGYFNCKSVKFTFRENFCTYGTQIRMFCSFHNNIFHLYSKRSVCWCIVICRIEHLGILNSICHQWCSYSGALASPSRSTWFNFNSFCTQ